MKKIKEVLNVILEDDDSLEGGISFVGETVKDFINEVEIDENDDISVLNEHLKECGIKPIRLIIHKKDIGWKVEDIEDGSIFYVGGYHDTGVSQGVIYKDYEAFKNKKGVCYINEYGFDNSEQNATDLFNFSAKARVAQMFDNNPYISETGYDYNMILDIAEGNENVAEDLFYNADWAAIETYFDEMAD